MKKLFVLLFPAVVFLAHPNTIGAQSPPENTVPSTDGTASGDEETAAYTLSPILEDIEDTTPQVTVTFNSGITSGEDGYIYICMESDLCIDNDNIKKSIAEGDLDVASLGMTKDDVDEKTIERYVLKENKIVVCGDGDNKLKGSAEEYYKGYDKGNNLNGGNWWSKIGEEKQGCEPERDYFHSGKTYIMAVYTKGSSDGEDSYSLRSIAGFYINHHFPTITFSPTENITPDTKAFTVSLGVDQTKGNKKKSVEDRNNYKVQLQASGYSESRCGWVTKESGTKTFTFTPKQGSLQKGKLTLTISEQINESDSIKSYLHHALDFSDNLTEIAHDLSNLPGNPNTVAPSSLCQGGFVYRIYTCEVSSDPKLGRCKTYSVPNPNFDPDNPTIAPRKITQGYLDDPNQVDIKGLFAYFDKLGVNAANTSYPCNIGSVTHTDPSGCKFVDTAIGKIPVDPLGFILRLFSIVLSIGGLGALILIIYSGYRLLISRGNPEMIKGARETLTSAIVGLLFIVFSLVILSIITGDILKIPNFNENVIQNTR